MYARQFPGLEGKLHGQAELQSSNDLQKSVNFLTSINQIIIFSKQGHSKLFVKIKEFENLV